MKKILSILLVSLTLSIAHLVSASASTAAFDPDNVEYCIFLNDRKRAYRFGHCALALVDANGNGRYYSYHNGDGEIPFGRGKLEQETLSPAQVTRLLKEGLVPNDTRGYYYVRQIQFDVTPEEGRAMYDYAESTEFKYYNIFAAGSPFTNYQCDTVIQQTLGAGNKRYQYGSLGIPIQSYYAIQWKLWFNDVEYEKVFPE